VAMRRELLFASRDDALLTNNKGYIFIVRRLGKQSKLILSRSDSISNLELNLRIHGPCGPDAHAGADLQVFLVFCFKSILISAHKLTLLIYGDNSGPAKPPCPALSASAAHGPHPPTPASRPHLPAPTASLRSTRSPAPLLTPRAHWPGSSSSAPNPRRASVSPLTSLLCAVDQVAPPDRVGPPISRPVLALTFWKLHHRNRITPRHCSRSISSALRLSIP
jgi:hypothetical protein